MTSALIPVPRVLVHILNGKNNMKTAIFSKCIFNQLYDIHDIEKLRVVCRCFLLDNKLILKPCINNQIKYENNDQPVYTLGHPPFCPFLNVTDDELKCVPTNRIEGGINVGVAVILETFDKMVLITRRAKHMRTFPGVWVPPGGHIDFGETLHEAGIRELYEETGLQLSSEEKKCGKILGLWESTFPPVLNIGPPLRHHIVVYMLFKMKIMSTELDAQMKLDSKEVDRSIWLPMEAVKSVVRGDPLPPNLKKLKYLHIDDKGVQVCGELDASVLEEKIPKPGLNIERISSGTRFALDIWLKDADNSTTPISSL